MSGINLPSTTLLVEGKITMQSVAEASVHNEMNNNMEQEKICEFDSNLNSSVPTSTVGKFIPVKDNAHINAGLYESKDTNSLRILNINFRSLRGKSSEVATIIDEYLPDVIIGTESWLTDEILNTEVFPKGFHVYRKDRPKNTGKNDNNRKNVGGGVFIAVANSIVSNYIEEFDTNCEIVWCYVADKADKKFYLCSFYRPPNNDLNAVEQLNQSLLKVFKHNNEPNILLAGDFNLPSINWKSCTFENCGVYASSSKLLLDMINTFGLEQMVLQPTRTTMNTSNILDLALTNQPHFVESISIEDGISDHNIVNITLNMNICKLNTGPSVSFLYDRSNFDEINKGFADSYNEFETNFAKCSVNENWSKFMSIYNALINKFTPTKLKSNSNRPPWVNRQHIRMARKLERLHKKAKKSGLSSDREALTNKRAKVQSNWRSLKQNYLSNVLGESLKLDNGKAFYRYLKQMRKGSNSLPALTTSDGDMITDTQSKLNTLNRQYQKVFTLEDDTDSLPSPQIACSDKMQPIVVTLKGTIKLLKELDSNKSSGPDGLHPKILKGCSVSIAPYLVLLFNQSLENGIVPDDWKSANVCPIFKNGRKSDPANYRPISLTSVCCKILEHIIFSAIMCHVDKNFLLSKIQHGFRKGLSCETQLLITYHEIAKLVNAGKQVDLVFLDFSKAFDRVPHKRLLSKIKALGIDDKVSEWIKSFLTDRNQRVVADGDVSEAVSVYSGVTQGSVLGPLLFLLYINDINIGIDSSMRLFADDCLLFKPVESIEDAKTLQDDLDEITMWCNTWKMSLNVKKCAVLRVGSSAPKTVFPYSLNGDSLSNCETYKYLGVTIDTKLNWSCHIENVCSQASRTLRLIQRTLGSSPKDVKAAAFNTLVLPQLEYAAMLWDPYQAFLVDNLQMVQRRAARFVLNRYSFDDSVTDMLCLLDWESLKDRRRNARLKMLYSMVQNLLPYDFLKIINILLASRLGRSDHSLKLCRLSAGYKFYQYSFFPRTIIEWNQLNEETVSSQSKNSFLSSLKRYLKTNDVVFPLYTN